MRIGDVTEFSAARDVFALRCFSEKVAKRARRTILIRLTRFSSHQGARLTKGTLEPFAFEFATRSTEVATRANRRQGVTASAKVIVTATVDVTRLKHIGASWGPRHARTHRKAQPFSHLIEKPAHCAGIAVIDAAEEIH